VALPGPRTSRLLGWLPDQEAQGCRVERDPVPAIGLAPGDPAGCRVLEECLQVGPGGVLLDCGRGLPLLEVVQRAGVLAEVVGQQRPAQLQDRPQREPLVGMLKLRRAASRIWMARSTP
jgi:hypothetical protein